MIDPGHKLAVLFALWAVSGHAQSLPEIERLRAATEARFPRVAALIIGDLSQNHCGGGGEGPALYCTSENRIYLSADLIGQPDSLYRLAHLYGHNIQVVYGIADIALREITARPAEETMLRGQVTRQVECLAGALVAGAGFDRIDLTDIYDLEPFTGSHWGRGPLSIGPQVEIGLDVRATWFARGQTLGRVGACAVGEMHVRPLQDVIGPD